MPSPKVGSLRKRKENPMGTIEEEERQFDVISAKRTDKYPFSSSFETCPSWAFPTTTGLVVCRDATINTRERGLAKLVRLPSNLSVTVSKNRFTIGVRALCE